MVSYEAHAGRIFIGITLNIVNKYEESEEVFITEDNWLSFKCADSEIYWDVLQSLKHNYEVIHEFGKCKNCLQV